MMYRLTIIALSILLVHISLCGQNNSGFITVIDALHPKFTKEIKAELLQSSFSHQLGFESIYDDEISFDTHDNIYVTDAKDWKILKFDPSGSYLSSITLSLDHFPQQRIKFLRLHLGVDGNDNLFVDICSTDREMAIYKYDSTGKFLMKFPFDSIPPNFFGDMVRAFNVSKRGNAFVGVFPPEILRPNFPNRVFAFDNSGKFRGMVDYFFEDSDGNAFTVDKTHKDTVTFTKFEQRPADDLKPSNYKKRLVNISFQEKGGLIVSPFGNHWSFAGFDSDDNLYLTNGVVTKKFDKNLKEVAEISTSLESLRKSSIWAQQNNVRVSPSGKIFIPGFQRGDGLNVSYLKGATGSFILLSNEPVRNPPNK